MTKVTRRKKELDIAALEVALTEFAGHKATVADISKRLDVVKKSLMAMLERFGERDEKGSLWIQLPTPVAGYKAIKRERRSSIQLDESRAESILRASGLYDQCVNLEFVFDADQFDKVIAALKEAGIYDEVVTVTERLSDDKIMQLYYAEKSAAEEEDREPKLTDADIDAMFVESVTWAFVPKADA